MTYALQKRAPSNSPRFDRPTRPPASCDMSRAAFHFFLNSYRPEPPAAPLPPPFLLRHAARCGPTAGPSRAPSPAFLEESRPKASGRRRGALELRPGGKGSGGQALGLASLLKSRPAPRPSRRKSPPLGCARPLVVSISQVVL